MSGKVTAAALCATLLTACGTASMPFSGVRLGSATLSAAPAKPMLYAYSPNGTSGNLAAYDASSNGSVKAASVLSGPETKFAGGSGYLYGGGIEIGSDGTLYAFDGMEGVLRTFAPGKNGAVAKGNVAPKRVEVLPQNANKKLNIPQYGGFAADTKGHFWTADRSTGQMVEFPMLQKGRVKAIATIWPQYNTPSGRGKGRASTVADDGHGVVYCSCQAWDMALQLYGISEYDMTGANPKYVRSFYGIFGNFGNQIPSTVIRPDPARNTVYVGYYKPAYVAAYALDADGAAGRARIIGGFSTGLDSNVGALTTDASGNLYIGINSSVLVFGSKDKGNVKPARTIIDPSHLAITGYSWGGMLVIR